MYEWNWVYTKAQLELLNADCMVTLYKDRPKEKKKGYEKPDKAKMDEAVRKWKLRKARRKFDLATFLGNGKNGEKGEPSEGKSNENPPAK